MALIHNRISKSHFNVVGKPFFPGVAPGIRETVPATRGLFPLRLGGEFLAGPATIGVRVIPVHRRYRVIGPVEAAVPPVGGCVVLVRRRARVQIAHLAAFHRLQKHPIPPVRNLELVHVVSGEVKRAPGRFDPKEITERAAQFLGLRVRGAAQKIARRYVHHGSAVAVVEINTLRRADPQRLGHPFAVPAGIGPERAPEHNKGRQHAEESESTAHVCSAAPHHMFCLTHSYHPVGFS